MPFLTELDERAQVKGSRDPLGVVPLWSTFGREIIGNLTTVSNSVRGFTTLLIALELADLLREKLREDAPGTLDVFLKFEQLAAYARCKYLGDKDVRGYRRVAQRLNNSDRVRVSAEQKDQILSNQKIYGLWGLFTVPARSSGLVRPAEARPTPDAQSFVHRNYLAMLGGDNALQALLDLLRRESINLKLGNGALLESIAKMHARKLRADERNFYRDRLAFGGPGDRTCGRQSSLARILAEVAAEEFGFAEFRTVQKKARSNEGLSDCLERIGCLERLIAPAGLLFGFLQDRDGQSLAAVGRQIRETWRRPLKIDIEGLRKLQAEISAAIRSAEESDLWIALADSLSIGAYEQSIKLLIRINGTVMQRRHGAAAWIAIESGRIRVRLSDERSELTSVEDAEQRWRSTYFVNSLWRISREVRD